MTWTGERVWEVDGPEGGTDLYETAAAFGRALGRQVRQCNYLRLPGRTFWKRWVCRLTGRDSISKW